MPRRKFFMRRRAYSARLDWRLVAYMFDGLNCSTGAVNYSGANAKALWQEHEETLMGWWFGGFPRDFNMNPFAWLGHSDTFPQPGRPWAWWRFSAPAPRRLLRVYRAGRQWDATPADEQAAYNLGLGQSKRVHECADGTGYFFESDSDYLSRHGLLTEREKLEMRTDGGSK